MMNKPTANVTLQRQLTSFIGREQELQQLAAMLFQQMCRLITVAGPGGIGKSRLVAELALRQQERFADGVAFVALQAITAPALLPTIIAEAIGCPLVGQSPPQSQLLHYLRPKQMLIILDNFEQLLTPPDGTASANNPAHHSDDDSIGLLSAILSQSEHVQLIVTSREVLNVQEEWLYPLAGLETPRLHDKRAIDAYSAVQLFADRVRRVRRDFDLAAEQAQVARICQLVEGMPLALELAATWAKTMRCAEIATEIQQGSEFLATNLRNLPERHRSIRAIFAYSWQLLSEEERSVFQKLTVFRGGFQRQAAEQVVGATLPILSTLVDKSLLRWEPDGRYQIHELLRQAAYAELAQQPGSAQAAQDAHGHYFANFADQRYKTLIGAQQPRFLDEIAPEFENLRQTWQWALRTANTEMIRKLADPLQQYLDWHGRCLEGVSSLAEAVSALEPLATARQPALTLAFVLTLLGWCHIRVGQLGAAEAALRRACTIYEHWNVLSPSGLVDDPWIGLANLANIYGRYAEAQELGEARRRHHEAQGEPESLQTVYYVLTNAVFALGDYARAGEYAQRAYSLSEATGNRWFGAFVLGDLGHIACTRGDFNQARYYYQESYAVKAAFADQEGMALALRNLANVALLEGDLVQAEALYLQSLASYRQIDDQGGLATVLCGLGDTASRFGNVALARQHFTEALQIAVKMRYGPLTLTTLVGVGELLLLTGQRERAEELFALAVIHPASQQETKSRARTALQRGRFKFTEESAREPNSATPEDDLFTLAEALALALSTTLSTDKSTTTAQQALIEPLTERELDVLQLLTDGLSNQEIADKLILAIGTVKFYTGAIYGKLGVNSRTQAIARARTLKLLSR